jgi:hypothetical protein
MRGRLGIAALTLGLALAGLVGVGTTPAGADATHAITVTPSTGLSNGQTVTVKGTGYVETPSLPEGWAVVQCSALILGSVDLQNAINNCDIATQPFTYAQADSSGNFTQPFVVRTTITTTAGSVTCGEAPNDCAILVAQVVDGGFKGSAVPISFGKPVPTLADCIRTFVGDHQHRPPVKLHRLLVCIFTALAHKPH